MLCYSRSDDNVRSAQGAGASACIKSSIATSLNSKSALGKRRLTSYPIKQKSFCAGVRPRRAASVSRATSARPSALSYSSKAALVAPVEPVQCSAAAYLFGLDAHTTGCGKLGVERHYSCLARLKVRQVGRRHAPLPQLSIARRAPS